MLIKHLTAIMAITAILGTQAHAQAHVDSRLNLPAEVLNHRSSVDAARVLVSAPPTYAAVGSGASLNQYIGVSPDKSLLAISTDVGILQVWSLPQRTLLNTINIARGNVVPPAIPLTGNQVIAVVEGTGISFYDTLQGNKISSVDLGAAVDALSISPNGQYFAAATANNIIVWKLGDGRVAQVFDAEKFRTGLMLTDHQLVYFTPQQGVTVRDLSTGNTQSFPLPSDTMIFSDRVLVPFIGQYGLFARQGEGQFYLFNPAERRYIPIENSELGYVFGVDADGQIVSEYDDSIISTDPVTGTVREITNTADDAKIYYNWVKRYLIGNELLSIEEYAKKMHVVNLRSGEVSVLGKSSAMDETASAYIPELNLLATASRQYVFLNYLDDPSRNRVIPPADEYYGYPKNMKDIRYCVEDDQSRYLYFSNLNNYADWWINLDTLNMGTRNDTKPNHCTKHSMASTEESIPPQVKAVAANIGQNQVDKYDVYNDYYNYYPDNNLIESANGGGIHYYDASSGKLRLSKYLFDDGEWVMVTPEGFFTASPHGAETLSINKGFNSFSIAQAYDVLNRPDLVAASFYGDPQGTVAAASAEIDLNRLTQSGAPPSVRFTDAALQTKQREYRISADLTDNGGGIGKLEWRVNGVVRNVAQRGMAAISGTRTTTTLALDPGDNLIELTAYNRDGLIASQPAQIRVQYQPGSDSAPHDPELYILSVGINNYADKRLHLNYAVPDAEAISNAFEQAGQGLFSRVHRSVVTDEAVNRDKLAQTFAEISAGMKPEDVFLFFIAGHGKTEDGRYYFIPHDFTYNNNASYKQQGIGQEQWQEWFAQIPAQKSVLLYDTCESGSMTRNGERGLDSLERDSAIDKLNKATGRTVLAATNDDAPALEGYGGHGIFTYSILEGVNNGDSNGDKRIDLSELINYVQQRVPEISEAAFGISQTPRIQSSGNTFPLANSIRLLDPSAMQNYPKTATHALKGGSMVYSEPNPQAKVNQTIANNVLYTVYLIEDNNGWAAIAKNGKPIGYVSSSQLVPLQ